MMNISGDATGERRYAYTVKRERGDIGVNESLAIRYSAAAETSYSDPRLVVGITMNGNRLHAFTA